MSAAVEHLACGSGLVNIYNFLREVNPSGRPADQLQQERDPPSIGKAAMVVSHPVSPGCRPKTLPTFLQVCQADTSTTNQSFQQLTPVTSEISKMLSQKWLTQVLPLG